MNELNRNQDGSWSVSPPMMFGPSVNSGKPFTNMAKTKPIRPGKGFQVMDQRKARRIQSAGGSAVASRRGHMRRLARASVAARAARSIANRPK